MTVTDRSVSGWAVFGGLILCVPLLLLFILLLPVAILTGTFALKDSDSE